MDLLICKLNVRLRASSVAFPPWCSNSCLFPRFFSTLRRTVVLMLSSQWDALSAASGGSTSGFHTFLLSTTSLLAGVDMFCQIYLLYQVCGLILDVSFPSFYALFSFMVALPVAFYFHDSKAINISVSIPVVALLWFVDRTLFDHICSYLYARRVLVLFGGLLIGTATHILLRPAMPWLMDSMWHLFSASGCFLVLASHRAKYERMRRRMRSNLPV